MKINGIDVELRVRPGFTVHRPDGTASLTVYVEAIVPPGPRGGGPGEPLPVEDAA